MGKKTWCLFSSTVMVLTQIVALLAIYYSTGSQPCFRNDECLYGQFCAMDGMVVETSDSAVYDNRCAWCSWGGPNDEVVAKAACSSSDRNASFELWLPPVLGSGPTVGFSAADLENFCEMCFTEQDELNTVNKAVTEQMRLLSSGDWITLALCYTVVGWYLVAEFRDIRLCQIELAEVKPRTWWHWCHGVLCWARTHIVVPLIVLTVTTIVGTTGANALSACFNSVAILFLLDLDELAYASFVDTNSRVEFESSSRLVLTEEDIERLDRAMHANRILPVLAMSAMTLAVFLAEETNPVNLLLGIVFAYSVISAVVEACIAGSPDRSIPFSSAMMRAIARSLGGNVVLVILIVVYSSLEN